MFQVIVDNSVYINIAIICIVATVGFILMSTIINMIGKKNILCEYTYSTYKLENLHKKICKTTEKKITFHYSSHLLRSGSGMRSIFELVG